MKKEYRIKRNQDFQTVFQSGKSSANRQFVVYVYERENQDHFRVGLSVSKKIGNAVTRNRIKRLIRQFFLEHKQMIKNRDYVIIARKPVATMNYEEVKSSLLHVFSVARMVRKTQK